jgi:hypothetical protein
MSKLYDAEKLLDETMDRLTEDFSPTVAIARIKGEKNLQWTDCYDNRCVRIENKYERDLCKEQCHMSAIDRALARIVTLRGSCIETSNPKACSKSINAAIESYKKRRIEIRNRVAEITRKVAAFRRRTGGGE